MSSTRIVGGWERRPRRRLVRNASGMGESRNVGDSGNDISSGDKYYQQLKREI